MRPDRGERLLAFLQRIASGLFATTAIPIGVLLVLLAAGLLCGLDQKCPGLKWLGAQLNPGFWQSLGASMLVVWVGFTFRVPIRRFFQPHVTYVRAPLMLGVAPLIIARAEGIWERHGLNMDLDFRYAGKDALDDLQDDRCPFAVASDVALCSFLGRERDQRLYFMPFVRIDDQLRFVVRKNNGNPEYQGSVDLMDKPIGYYPDSVHDHLLYKLGLFDPKNVKAMTSILGCYRALAVERSVEACLLWEPHYRAFTNFEDISTLNDDRMRDYVWFLCLAAKRDYLVAHRETAQRVLMAMRGATGSCRGRHDTIVTQCASFLHSEFTGIQLEELHAILDERNHDFGVDSSVPPLLHKLNDLKSGLEGIAFGAGSLRDSLWPGIRI